MAIIQLKRRCRVALLAGALAVLLAPSVATAQTPPPTLNGQHLFASPPGGVGSVTITSANCDPADTSTFSFVAIGQASIAYTGTFTESGTVTIGPQDVPSGGGFVGPVTGIDSTYTIDSASPSATVTGEKHLAPGAAATGFCNASGESAGGPQIVTYSGTVAPADGGLFSDFGTADLGVTATALQAQFVEAFFSQQSETIPVLPTSKDQCKDGGWRAFGFKNQGQCIKAVVHGA